MSYLDEIKQFLRGDVAQDEKTRDLYSRDASLFEIRPEAVIFPKDVEDVKDLVKFSVEKKKNLPNLSLTARSGGSDMTGATLSESLILNFTKYFNRLKEIGDDYAVVEPGLFYRDFEKETFKRRLMLPSYPASKEICALGGMVANNAGGEKSLIYGKTENYVEELKVVLADGNEYVFKKLPRAELEAKIKQSDFEGEIYRKIYDLLEKNYELAKNAKPNVSKNSSGYNIWDVWDRENFDLTKLFTGSQGTLGIITEMKLRLAKIKPYRGMAVVFLKDLKPLAEIANTILAFRPSSLESFDDNTLKLALRFLPSFLKLLGAKNLFSLGLRFLPDFFIIVTFGMPKLILLAEFEGDNQKEIEEKINGLKSKLK